MSNVNSIHLCAACNSPLSHKEPGMKIQFCFECEKKWQISPERVEASTARLRFAQRMTARNSVK